MYCALFPYIKLNKSEHFIYIILDKASNSFYYMIHVGLRTEHT
jgi:hypothetical protein